MHKTCTLILILALSTTALADTSDCERARELDGRAVGLEDTQPRISAYQEIVSLCPNFNYLYKLGRTLQEGGDAAGAKNAFEQARALVGDTRAEGLLYGRLAEVNLTLGKPAEAVAIADVAVSLTQPEVPEWMREVRKQADLRLAEQPITAEGVTRGLSTSRSFAVRPRIHLQILFNIGHDTLTEEGRTQVAELGKALAALLTKKETVQIIGHTDSVGYEFFNLRLSKLRAERVMEAILADQPKLAGRIVAVGHGGTEPRYPGRVTDEEKRLNRRVEVVLGH